MLDFVERGLDIIYIERKEEEEGLVWNGAGGAVGGRWVSVKRLQQRVTKGKKEKEVWREREKDFW